MTGAVLVAALCLGCMFAAIALVRGGSEDAALDRQEREHRNALRRLEKQWNDDHGGAA